MSKEEVFYKFIFPTYEHLKTSDVKSLYDGNDRNSDNSKCVETYERLSTTLKSYVDNYIRIPKYFNLRIYEDDVAGNAISGKNRQKGGFSLIVSRSPEVNNKNATQSWTKFNVGSSTIYCSIIVSSGNFFYNFNLPEEVLAKSGLRDSIVSSKFHSNWYATQEECTNYQTSGYGNGALVGTEKYVFNTQYFKPTLQYALRRVGGNWYVPTTYGGSTGILEDLKKDFVDLEVTRRILYGNDGSNHIDSISGIPSASGVGTTTVLSFDPPQEYINHKPMPIKYWLLRDSLNDKEPYGDCETVLVMWVADGDPADISDGNVSALRGLDWRQYAIPLAVRCCKTNGEYNSERFLISYPHKYSPGSPETDAENEYVYRFHTRRAEGYDKNSFKDALYLQDMVRYSNDYVLAFQNKKYVGSDPLNIQNHLFNNYRSSFECLYARKNYRESTSSTAANLQQQAYYIYVDEDLYTINTGLNICLADKNNSTTIFKPSNYILQSDYEDKWDLVETPWNDNSTTVKTAINDNWFITIFNLDDPRINEATGTLKLVNAGILKSALESLTRTDWTNLYLSSLGISYECNWCYSDCLLYHIGSAEDVCVPLGFLDNHICIGGVTYGSTVNHKAVIGFKNVFDYTYADYHHFVYNSSLDEYELVVDSNKSLEYTAFIVNIT